MTDSLPTDQQVQESPWVHKQFKLLTNGADEELDALHIIVEAMGGLDGDQIRRILAYLSERYSRRG